jgi:hypothetical protein
MNRPLCIAVAWAGLITASLGQSGPAPTNAPLAAAPTPSSDPPITQIKKSVVFIEGRYRKQAVVDGVPQVENGAPRLEDNESTIDGTGFLIAYPEERLGKDEGIIFLVTNKHMVREPGPDGTLGKGKYLKNVMVRMNGNDPIEGTDIYFRSGPVAVTDDATDDLDLFVDPTTRTSIWP